MHGTNPPKGRKPKLTPTFADGGAGDAAVAEAVPHVEPPHEPLPGVAWPISVSWSTPPAVNMPDPPPVGMPEPAPIGMQEPPPVKMADPIPLKIALVGTAPSSRHLAPYNDPTWKIWACSPGNAHGQIPRADVWFEIHNNLLWPENKHYGEPYLKWLSEQSFLLYMQDQSQVARATTFPKDELVAKFGRFFFTSSFAWMLALAIHQGANEIALYGIDMASRDEYILQRPGGHYFMQLAAQRGIKVSVPYESDLAQPPALYGYSDAGPFGRKLAARRAEIKSRIAQMTAERDKLNQNVLYLQGADEDLDYICSIWGGIGEGG